MRLIENADAVIKPTPRKIVYYFTEYQLLFECYKARVDFRHGMPKADAIDRQSDALVAFDNMMDEADES